MQNVQSLGRVQTQQRPRVQLTRVFDPEMPDPNAPTYRFLNNIGQFHQVKIVAYNDDPEDTALTQAVLNRHPAGYLEFRDWAFTTQWPSVAQYLTKRIREGRVVGIVPDDASVMMRCPVGDCDRLFPSTQEGRRQLAEHQFDHDVPSDETALPRQFAAVAGAAPHIVTARREAEEEAAPIDGPGYAEAMLEALAERDAAQRELAMLRAEKEAAYGGVGADQELQHRDGWDDERRGSGDPADDEGDPRLRDDAGDPVAVLPGNGERGAGGGRQHVHRAGGAGGAGRAKPKPKPAA